MAETFQELNEEVEELKERIASLEESIEAQGEQESAPDKDSTKLIQRGIDHSIRAIVLEEMANERRKGGLLNPRRTYA